MAKRRRDTGYSYKKKANPFTIWGVLVLCLVLCGTFAYKTITLHAQKTAYDEQLQQLQLQKEELQEEEKELEDFKQQIKTDEYIEDVAREKLGLVHEGEIVFKPENK